MKRKLRHPVVWAALAVMFYLLHTAGSNPVLLSKVPTENFYGIPVKGVDKFRAQIHQALDLLNAKAFYDLEDVKRGVKKITQGYASGIDEATGELALTERTAYSSVTWCASVLAHEACHVRQRELAQRRDLTAKKGSMTENELECNALQVEVLKKIGAPESETQYLRRADGKHWDLDGDGKYTHKDYELRNW
jgi:hypothetical protein